jgi:hypothetical protein
MINFSVQMEYLEVSQSFFSTSRNRPSFVDEKNKIVKAETLLRFGDCGELDSVTFL